MRIMLASGKAAVDFGMFSAPRAHWLGERGRQEKKMETQSRNDNVTRVFGMSSAGRRHWLSERGRQEKKMKRRVAMIMLSAIELAKKMET